MDLAGYYQMDLYEEQQGELKVKIIIVGDSGVGKSNIRNSFCRGKFQAVSYKTVGIEFSSRRFKAAIEDRPVHFSAYIWDVAGDINNADIPQGFFKNICGVIYVCDLTNLASMEGIEAWQQKVLKYSNCPDVIEMLLANKSDLVNLREIEQKTLLNFARDLNIPLCFETSAYKVKISEDRGVSISSRRRNSTKLKNNGESSQKQISSFLEGVKRFQENQENINNNFIKRTIPQVFTSFFKKITQKFNEEGIKIPPNLCKQFPRYNSCC